MGTIAMPSQHAENKKENMRGEQKITACFLL
jgi:hypothetical protein